MNGAPPSWNGSQFNSNAFGNNNSFLTKTEADMLYLPLSAGRNLALIDGITPGIVLASKAVIVDASKNITGFGSLSANTVSATTLTGTISTAAQPNITSLGTLSSLTMGGNITMGSNSITGATTISATTLTGTISTAAQPNITSLGTLSSLTMGGSITMGSNSISGAGTIGCSTINASTAINITSTTDSTSISTGSFTSLGGMGIAKSIWGGTTLNIAGQSNLNSVSNQGNLLTGDVGSPANGYFRIVNSAAVCYIQTGVSSTGGSSADLFFGNISQAFNSSSRRLILKASGFLGINTYSPQTNCVVNGTLRICNSSDGTETDYSELSNQTSGGLQIKLNGSLYQNLRLQQQGATTNQNSASGLDMGTAYQARALAITATAGGVSGSEFYGLGSTSSQNLEHYSYGNHRFITGTTLGTLGSLRAIITQAGQFGVNNSSPQARVDCNGYFRCTEDTSAPSSGSGLEISYASSVASIKAYDRSAAAYKDISLNNNIRITASGRVGIGITNPSFPLDINQSDTTSTLLSYGYLAGSGAGTASTFVNRSFSIRTSSGIFVTGSEIDVLSDIRSKRNIDIIPEEVVNKVLRTDPIQFQYNAQHEDDKRFHLGYRAQDLVKRGLPELVGYCESDEPLGDQDIECDDGNTVYLRGNQRLVVNLIEFIPVLHRALQMQQLRLDEQQTEIDELKSLLSSFVANPEAQAQVQAQTRVQVQTQNTSSISVRRGKRIIRLV